MKPAYVSKEAERAAQDKLDADFSVAPWMVNIVVKSLPYLADHNKIHKTLVKHRGDVDGAVSELLDAEERSSVSSNNGSSSVERDAESEDEFRSAPNKKQDRRLSRATRSMLKQQEGHESNELVLRPKRADVSTDTPVEIVDDKDPGAPQALQIAVEDTDDEDCRIDPTRKGSDSSQDSAALRPGGVKPEPSQQNRISSNDETSSQYSQQSAGGGSILGARAKQRGAKHKALTARDRRDLKKMAQKAASKQRKQAMAAGRNGNSATDPTANANKKGKENSPGIDTVIKTLYI